MIEEIMAKIESKTNLSEKEAEEVFTEIMRGDIPADRIAAFLLALKEKKETIEEITGAAMAMRRFATKIRTDKETVLDTCGTGGDKSDTFNISTISAFVAAGAGCIVAKHGNKAVSSRCGSADLLEELGININVGKETVERCIAEAGIGFLFAPSLHLAMKYAMPARRMIKTRSIFNILGPLTNPAGARYQILGVYDEGLVETMARVLKNLGSQRAMVIYGKDGLDEVTTAKETIVAELKDGKIKIYTIKPEEFGMERVSAEELKGGDPALNAKIAAEILNGEKGARRDITVLNSACAIYITGLAASIGDGIEKAQDSIDSGRAMAKLGKLKELTNWFET